MNFNLDEKIGEIKDEVIEIYKELHKIPEPGLEEHKTSQKILSYLDGLEVEMSDRIAQTGIMGYISGNVSGATVLLRADMDGLPIEENTGLPYKSRHSGWMHACGHDAHMAILLGTIKLMHKMKDKLPGNIKFVFQPAEETVGGAARMIESGILEKFSEVDYALALHVDSSLETGYISLAPEYSNASSKEWEITLKGKGGHGAYPHQGDDLPFILGKLLNMMEGMGERCTPGPSPVVLSVGKIQGGSAGNVFPDKIEIKGILRTIKERDEDIILSRLRNILSGLEKAYEIKFNFNVIEGYPALINDEEVANLIYDTASQYLGEKRVNWIDNPQMGVEDFAYFLREVPGVFWQLGCRNEEKNCMYPGHTPKFNVDEKALLTGVKLQTLFAWKLMRKC